jgi:hypothetical protein
LKNNRFILAIFFALIIFSQSVLALTSDWVLQFRADSLCICKISHSNGYQSSQASLKILETKGKGNCVAWSKFMVKIAIEHKIEFDNYIVGRNIDGKNVGLVNHQITILKDSTHQLWLQSNANLMMIKDMKDALTKVVKEVDPKWKLGYRLIYKVTIRNQDLYK